MRQEIDTGLPSLGQPFICAVGDQQMVYTSHGPVTPEGRFLKGDVRSTAMVAARVAPVMRIAARKS